MIFRLLRNRTVLLYSALFLISLIAAVAVNRWQYNFWARQTTFIADMPSEPTVVAPSSAGTAQPQAGLALPSAWDGTERVNILIMAIDQRDGEKDKGFRTDTMIVATVDPVTLKAGLLSVPRDTWVNIPGYRNNRINVANQIGDADDYPGGGSALAKKTVEGFLGIKINYTVRVNFTAFESFIDHIGGITVDVPADINDPEYPTSNFGVETFKLSKGVQKLDGSTALKFARTRHNVQGGDFGRARHQQLVILGVQQQLKDPKVLVSLLAQGPELIDELSASVKTTMTLDQMQKLLLLGLQIKRTDIQMAVLDENYTTLTITAEDGAAVQVPDREKIAKLREQFFAAVSAGRLSTPSPTP